MSLLYWLFKWVLFTPFVRSVFRPTIEGEHNIPATGPAILVSNHLSAGDTFMLPAMIRRRLTWPAKAELFSGSDWRGRVVAWFLVRVGQLPLDRSGGRASATSMDNVLGVLKRGQLLGIFPEGTRSPDGRLYKGKTGVARLVLSADVPVIPVAMINSQFVKSPLFGLPLVRNASIRIGAPMDFRRYASAGNDRDVLRWVTDEIMNAVMELSGQTYVDAYGSSVKTALEEGTDFPTRVLSRPGEGRPVPPVPSGPSRPEREPLTGVDPTELTA